MTKKNSVISIVVLLVLITAGIVAIKKDMLFSKYTINGTVSKCSTNGKAVYQYTANTPFAQPQHYTESGQFVPCKFNGKIPSEECKSVLSNLHACQLIYRTNTDWRSLPGIYESSAREALQILKGKVR